MPENGEGWANRLTDKDCAEIDTIANKIIQTYGSNPEVLRSLMMKQPNISRYNTLEDIAPFLRNQTTIESAPDVYLALARKWNALRKKTPES